LNASKTILLLILDHLDLVILDRQIFSIACQLNRDFKVILALPAGTKENKIDSVCSLHFDSTGVAYEVINIGAENNSYFTYYAIQTVLAQYDFDFLSIINANVILSQKYMLLLSSAIMEEAVGVAFGGYRYAYYVNDVDCMKIVSKSSNKLKYLNRLSYALSHDAKLCSNLFQREFLQKYLPNNPATWQVLECVLILRACETVSLTSALFSSVLSELYVKKSTDESLDKKGAYGVSNAQLSALRQDFSTVTQGAELKELIDQLGAEADFPFRIQWNALGLWGTNWVRRHRYIMSLLRSAYDKKDYLHVLRGFVARQSRVIFSFINGFLGRLSNADIPVIINNRNRLTSLLKLLDWLEKSGFSQIIILDNASTYLPLLQYYKTTQHKVIFLNENAGPLALWKNKELKSKYCKKLYIYTDSDIIPHVDCPKDIIQRCVRLFMRYPRIDKIGFALKIDDIPEHYHLKEDVVGHESQYWQHQIRPDVYFAPIDTTFAVYRPGAYGGHWLKSLRLAGLYTAQHWPWYQNSSKLDEEELFYKSEASVVSSWSFR
jgi:hypothetical protein